MRTSPTRRVVGLAGVTVVLAAATVLTWSWPGEGEAAPGEASASAPPEGANLFRAKGCATCHQGHDTRPPVPVGPNLAGPEAVAATRQPGVSAPDYVRRSITAPDSFVVAGFPGEGMGAMPTLAVSEAELEALVAYLLDPGP